MTIRTFEHDFADEPEVFLLRNGSGVLPTEIAKTGVPARIDHSRWVVDCPFCPSAQLVMEQKPLFYCVSCKNAGVEGKWLPVLFPNDRHEIEEILLMRPEQATRNWRSGETQKHLRRENAEHGV